MHDSCHLRIAAVPHVLHATAVHVVPDLGEWTSTLDEMHITPSQEISSNMCRYNCSLQFLGDVHNRNFIYLDCLVAYLYVSRPGASYEPPPRAIQSHGGDLVLVVGVREAEDLSTAVDVPHVHLPSLTPTHNLTCNS